MMLINNSLIHPTVDEKDSLRIVHGKEILILKITFLIPDCSYDIRT